MKRLTCGNCPTWANGWCGYLAKIMIAAAPMCDFGRRALTNLRAKLYMRKRRESAMEYTTRVINPPPPRDPQPAPPADP